MSSDKELRNLKIIIKSWESEFAKSNQRKPSKEDIKEASSEIKDAYKSYWIIKNNIQQEIFNKVCKTLQYAFDDVWSERLNKSYEENVKVTNSEGIVRNYCKKLKERSCDIKQIDFKRIPQKEKNIMKLDSSMNMNKNVDSGISSDLTETFDNADLSNSDIELEAVKPMKRIMKINTATKKFKSINVLSTSFNIKNPEKNLSLKMSVDSDWLERCYSDHVNNSLNTDMEVNEKFSPKKNVPVFNISECSYPKVKQEDQLMLTNKSEIEDCHLIRSSCTESNFLNCSDKDVSPINETGDDQKSPSISSITKNYGLNSDSCLDEQNLKPESQVKMDTNNTVDSTLENCTKNNKRKLAKTCIQNTKLSSHLERKMSSGTMNENFVKINIKKKKFSRGHRAVNVRKLKWKKWKDLKKFNADDVKIPSLSTCFKCGQVGHWARNCKLQSKNNQQIDPDMEDIDDAPLPTLEEAAELAKKSKTIFLKEKSSNINSTISSNPVSREEALQTNELNRIDSTLTNVKPFYELTDDGKPIATPSDVFESLKELGYSHFREGQEVAVMRVLCGLSTLVVLPTGSGKSLCYQLPAYMYAKQFKYITLVISPLVSLMEDQVTGLPSCLHAICLHSGMTNDQKKASLEDLNNGKAQMLLVSPEAVVGGLAYGSCMLPSNLPPIAFACIDEVHCLSQWSHNFRPSYLQLYKVLTEQYNVKCILGLTATANQSTAKEIISHLGLKSCKESVVGSTGIPRNLHLSVSRDKDKDKALIQLLLGDRFNNCSSIIIYCIRRDETERISTLIRTLLQDEICDEPPSKKRKSKSKKRNFLWTAEAYHAGLPPPRRRSIQKKFMTGKLRVIVATIAFGMGLDKRDVRAVIHYNMPKSFESYVQEIGRAGRDGLDSHCHLFLDYEGKDINELQRFIHSNSTDRYVIRKLLKKVFLTCQCKTSSNKHNEAHCDNELQVSCPKHEIAFCISETVQELDMKEENILTLLCYLELHPKKWIEVLSPTYATCTIRCYGGPKQLHTLASKSPPVAAAFALDRKKNENMKNISTYNFAVVEVASTMGWNTGSVKRALKNLEWNDQKRKSGVIVDFSDLAFHIRSPGNLSDDELDEVLDFLYQKVITTEKEELLNLKSLHSIFSNYSYPHYWECSEEAPIASSESIKKAVNNYFDEPENLELQHVADDNISVDTDDCRYQIRDIIFTNNDQNFTGRSIARIFHGIGSPCFPSEVWGRVRKFWRCLLHIDFNLLVKLANEELKKAK